MDKKRLSEFVWALDVLAARVSDRRDSAEIAHGDADDVLLDVLAILAPEVVEAYRRVVAAAEGWSTA